MVKIGLKAGNFYIQFKIEKIKVIEDYIQSNKLRLARQNKKSEIKGYRTKKKQKIRHQDIILA